MAITQTYVDYGAGDDTTGNGTIGTPYKTLQKAFDTLTRNNTDGNQVNLKAGTAHVNGAALSLATFIGGGALSAAAPLILRGYTSAASDGGIGEIDCNGATMWAAATYDYLILADLEVHNGGNNTLCTIRNYCTVYHCEFHKGASTPSGKNLLSTGTYNRIIGCYAHDAGSTGYCISVNNYTVVVGCYVTPGAGASYGIAGNLNCIALQNVISLAATGAIGIWLYGGNNVFWGNTVYNSTAGTTAGIESDVGTVCVILNNLLVGFSGVGGRGVYQKTSNVEIVGYNAFYNNTSTYVLDDQKFLDLTGHDVALAADPFTNAAGGDFSVSTALKALGFPASFLGSATNDYVDIGAAQRQEPAGGAVSISPSLGSVGAA